MEPLTVRRNKSFVIILVFFVFLLLNIFIEKMSSYGYIQSIVIAIVTFFCGKWRNSINNLTLTGLLLIPILLVANNGILYFVDDFLTLFLVFSFIDAFRTFDLTDRQAKFVAGFLLAYSLIFILCTALPSFYDESEGRYRGLLHGGNTSSSVMMLILAFLIEYYKRKKIKYLVYTVSFACFLVSLFLCNTRSVFFVIPYLFWLYKENINFKKAWPILLIIVGICVYAIIPQSSSMSEDLRLSDEDASFLTRAYLYEKEFEGISKNHYVIPYGSNACVKYIKNLTNDDRYSPHNSLLSYWYDWGVIWLIVLLIMFVRIKRFVKAINFRIGALLLFLFVLSCGLHNIMLHINIWIPLVLIMWRCRIQNNIHNALICQKKRI